MNTRKTSILLATVSLTLFMIVTLALIPGQASLAGQRTSPLPTPVGSSLTFVSPLLPQNLTPQAKLPLIANNFPLYMTYGKKGVGDSSYNWINGGSGSNMAALNYDWYYDWGYNLVPGRNNDLKYVRMVYCLGYEGLDMYGVPRTITETARGDFVANRRERIWLVFNEPDGTGECGRETFGFNHPVYSEPVMTAHYYSGVYDMIKAADPYAKVYAGGLLWLNTTETHNWWQSFVNTLRSENILYKLEGVHIHLYPKISTSSVRGVLSSACTYPNCIGDLARVADDWFTQMHEGLGLHDLPIWITEMGWLTCDGPTYDWVRDIAMIPMSQWFAGDTNWPYYQQIPLNPGYDTAAWFVTHDPRGFACTWLLSNGPTGTLTSLGTQWNAYHP
jgi:hypothetical protein